MADVISDDSKPKGIHFNVHNVTENSEVKNATLTIFADRIECPPAFITFKGLTHVKTNAVELSNKWKSFTLEAKSGEYEFIAKNRAERDLIVIKILTRWTAMDHGTKEMFWELDERDGNKKTFVMKEPEEESNENDADEIHED